MHTDILVIGGGVIGSAIAYECAKAGRSVTVLDRHRLGSEASCAAAGMLGAQVESHHPGAFYDLCKASRDMYRDWVQELEMISGISSEYVASGILRVALTEEDALELQHRLSWLEANVRWLSPDEVRELEPAVSERCLGGLWFAGDHQVQAAKLAESLRVALQRLNVHIVENVEVTNYETDSNNSSLKSVIANDTRWTADCFVVAAGAWSQGLLAPLGIELPVKPIKGQLFSVRPKSPLIRSTLFTKGCYIVPKQDGSYVIGATEEDCGFDKQIIPSAVDQIERIAQQLLPALTEAQLERTWTGLRPGSVDGMPFLGAAPGWENLFVAAGHYRNGILLTPITAKIVSELVLVPLGPKVGSGQHAYSIDLQPFAVGR